MRTSPRLQTALALAFGALISPKISSAFDLNLNFAPPGQNKTLLRASGSILSEMQTSESAPTTGINQEAISASIPVAQGEKDVWTISGQLQVLNIDTAQALPEGPTSVPAHFYNPNIGLSYAYHMEPGNFWAGNASFGSPSDKPFSSIDVDSIGATIFRGFKDGEKSSWVLLLNYSNNRPFLNHVPLPGFAYTYMPNKEFRLTAGAPFLSLRWEFVPTWTVSFFTVVPWVLKADIAKSVFGPVQVYTAFDFSQQLYFRADRTDTNDRFFFDEKKLVLGARSPLSQVLFADLSAGYGFQRSFFEAESYGDRRENRVWLGGSFVVSGSLSARL